jgi:hypothetical protein
MKKCVAICLVSLLAAPTVARAEEFGAISGRIVVASGSHAAKAVWLADAGGGSLLLTIPVAPDGTFRAAPLEAGTLALAVETDEGLYTVESPVTIAPGTTRSLSIALRGREDTKPPKETAPKKKSLGVWNNPLFASLIVIGGAIVVGVAVDQLTDQNKKTTPVSPSVPGD